MSATPMIYVGDDGTLVNGARIAMPPALCRAMKVLSSRMPQAVPHETLRLALRSGYRWNASIRRDPYHNVVKVQMCKLRKLLAPAGLVIETAWGTGYALRWVGEENDGAPPQ